MTTSTKTLAFLAVGLLVSSCADGADEVGTAPLTPDVVGSYSGSGRSAIKAVRVFPCWLEVDLRNGDWIKGTYEVVGSWYQGAVSGGELVFHTVERDRGSSRNLEDHFGSVTFYPNRLEFALDVLPTTNLFVESRPRSQFEGMTLGCDQVKGLSYDDEGDDLYMDECGEEPGCFCDDQCDRCDDCCPMCQ